ncbi:MAG: zf-HC2 domain-containing protein [Acidobacteria bacterium]|nr:zf-HC2 domain-containing protein [Acidobacteriota bacterium]
MTSDARHPRDQLQDLLDDRLGPTERAEVRAHLEACDECRNAFRRIEWVKRQVTERLTTVDVPARLRADMAAALDREEASARSAFSWWRGGATWQLAAAATTIVLVAVVATWFYAGRTDLVAGVARDYRGYLDGSLTVERRTSSPAELEAFFRDRGIQFRTRVFDLGMMQYRLVGGRVHAIDGSPTALYGYRHDGGATLLCQMYEGRLEDLRGDAVVREHGGITFRMYQRDGVTLVFWQEGPVTCVLASDIASDEVLQLAFAKAEKL